eukprot:TRINITY_DN76748_c0_g1_i1.p1 TRINITY_DN76748_c0_g1~~TRINITY_DN76748_c0_g1_i1.p1  ORF type:complete len:559 (+),score=93.23 TRINITY_DN76748_c0_g1_i1:40-1677(+)
MPRTRRRRHRRRAAGATENDDDGDAGDADFDDSQPIEAILEQHRFQGVIKSFVHEKKYGFIDCARIKKLFSSRGKAVNDVYLSEKDRGGFDTGDVVSFKVRLNGNNQPQASDLAADVLDDAAEDDSDPVVIRCGDKFAVSMRQRLRTDDSVDAFLEDFEFFVSNQLSEEDGSIVFEDFDLSENLISLEAFRRIFDLLSDQAIQVERLRLFGCATIDDEVCCMIAGWLETVQDRYKPLEIHLSNCAITDAGFEDLLFGMGEGSDESDQVLVQIRLENNYISQETLQARFAEGLLVPYQKDKFAAPPINLAAARCRVLVQAAGRVPQKTGTPPDPADAPPPKPLPVPVIPVSKGPPVPAPAAAKAQQKQKGSKASPGPLTPLEEAFAWHRFDGVIKSFFAEKRYGFVDSMPVRQRFRELGQADPGDVFLHQNQRAGFVVGDFVSFRVQIKDGKPQAADLAPGFVAPALPPGAWSQLQYDPYGYGYPVAFPPPPPPEHVWMAPPPGTGLGPGWIPHPGEAHRRSRSRSRGRAPAPTARPRPTMAAHLR